MSNVDTTGFDYSAIDMMKEYREMEEAVARHEGDPVAQLLIKQEASSRMNLGDAMGDLRKAAAKLAREAQRIVDNVDRFGLEYRPNSLGEIQGDGVDIHCAKVYAAQKLLESVQKQLRDHLAGKEDEQD